jgi:hypothetical protein
MFSIQSAVTLLAAAAALFSQPVHGADRLMQKKELHARQVEAAKRWQTTPHIKRDTTVTPDPTSAPKNLTFSNPKAARKLIPSIFY